MFGFLGRKKSQPLRGDELGAFLNDALNAYVATFPVEENLKAFLARHGREGNLAGIKATLDAAIGATEEILWKEPGGVLWTEEFKGNLFQAVRVRNPWLSQQGFSSLVSFGGWLCWHEGLNA